MVNRGCPIHYSVKAAMFFGSPENLTFFEIRGFVAPADDMKLQTFWALRRDSRSVFKCRCKKKHD